jgi:hypothetical protein
MWLPEGLTIQGEIVIYYDLHEVTRSIFNKGTFYSAMAT